MALYSSLTDLRGFQSAHTLTDADLQFLGDVNGDHRFTNADLQALLTSLITGNGGGSGSTVEQPAAAAAEAVAAKTNAVSENLKRESYTNKSTIVASPSPRARTGVNQALLAADHSNSNSISIPALKRHELSPAVSPFEAQALQRARADGLDHYFALFADGGDSHFQKKPRAVAVDLFAAPDENARPF